MLASKKEHSEQRLPLFINHDSARYWFKQQYGSRFVMVDSTIENDVKFYIYHLVHDRKAYVQSMNAIREDSPFIHSDFKNSYEEIEISEYGYVFLNYH